MEESNESTNASRVDASATASNVKREFFSKQELMYLGEREGEHWYLIAGEHEVPVSAIEDLTQVSDDAV